MLQTKFILTLFIFIFFIIEVAGKDKNIQYYNLIKKEISVDTIKNLNLDELRKLRNTIFAKHGYCFKSQDLQKHFSRFQWYQCKYKNVDSFLTKLDKKNIKFVQSQERGKKTSKWIDKKLNQAKKIIIKYKNNNDLHALYLTKMKNVNNPLFFTREKNKKFLEMQVLFSGLCDPENVKAVEKYNKEVEAEIKELEKTGEIEAAPSFKSIIETNYIVILTVLKTSDEKLKLKNFISHIKKNSEKKFVQVECNKKENIISFGYFKSTSGYYSTHMHATSPDRYYEKYGFLNNNILVTVYGYVSGGQHYMQYGDQSCEYVNEMVENTNNIFNELKKNINK